MRKSINYVVLITVSVLLSQIPASAQRGRGQSSSAPGGGQGGMMAPSQTRMPDDHGMQGMPPRGKADETPGHPVSKPTSERNDTKAQRAVADRLADNTKLSSHLQTLLPAGTSVSDAAAGFKNLGDLVAAAHVSHNLGIPFANLKAKLMAKENLGQAIHDLRPDVDHNAEAKKAKAEAKKVMKDSGA